MVASNGEQAGQAASIVRLSYKELADRLGMTLDAARIKAKRRWKVELGNDGKAVVSIPAVELAELERERPPVSNTVVNGDDRRPIEPDHDGQTFSVVQALRQELTEAQAALVESREQAAASAATAAELRLVVEHERQTYAAHLAHERLVAAELRAELRELRRPWWTRLWPKAP